jgi:hypothetical protein
MSATLCVDRLALVELECQREAEFEPLRIVVDQSVFSSAGLLSRSRPPRHPDNLVSDQKR